MNMIVSQSPETTQELGGVAKGVAVAVVCDNRDPHGMGRVRVTYPWHTVQNQSFWARVAAPMAGKNRGIFFLPEVDDEVLVVFDRGDVRFPYIIGALWNGKDGPPEDNGDGKNDLRVIKTRKGHILTFDDGTKGRIKLELNDGKQLLIDDDGVKLDDGGGNSLAIDSRGGSMTIKAATRLSISAPTIEIKASAQMTVDGGGVLIAQGGVVKIN